MAGEFFGTGGGEKLATERNIPFLGRVPMASNVREGGDYGRPVTIHDADSESGQAFRKLAETIAARISVVMLNSANVIPINVIG